MIFKTVQLWCWWDNHRCVIWHFYEFWYTNSWTKSHNKGIGWIIICKLLLFDIPHICFAEHSSINCDKVWHYMKWMDNLGQTFLDQNKTKPSAQLIANMTGKKRRAIKSLIWSNAVTVKAHSMLIVLTSAKTLLMMYGLVLHVVWSLPKCTACTKPWIPLCAPYKNP